LSRKEENRKKKKKGSKQKSKRRGIVHYIVLVLVQRHVRQGIEPRHSVITQTEREGRGGNLRGEVDRGGKTVRRRVFTPARGKKKKTGPCLRSYRLGKEEPGRKKRDSPFRGERNKKNARATSPSTREEKEEKGAWGKPREKKRSIVLRRSDKKKGRPFLHSLRQGKKKKKRQTWWKRRGRGTRTPLLTKGKKTDRSPLYP